MRKRMQQRVALFLSFAMAFTSIDSSVLVAASDVTDIVSEETHDHAAEETGLAESVQTEYADENLLSEDSDGILDAESEISEEVILEDTSETEDEQIIGEEADLPSEEADVSVENSTEVTAPEENVSGVTITGITGTPEKEQYIMGLDHDLITSNTRLQVTYSDGKTKTYTLYNDQFEDKYGTIIPFYLKNTEDESIWHPGYGQSFHKGIWKLICEINGEAFETDVTYQIVSVGEAELPELETGEVTFHSGNSSYNWYQFTAPETGKYFFKEYNNLSVYQKTTAGVVGVDSMTGTFRATAGDTYYLGFSGPVRNELTYQWEYDVRTTFGLVQNEVQSVTNIMPAREFYLSGIENHILAYSNMILTYSNGETKTVSWPMDLSYSDGKGNTITATIRQENSSKTYSLWDRLKEGNYAIEFDLDGKEIGNSGYIYHVKNAETAGLPSLTVGDNEITGSSSEWYNWYQFTAPKTGKYRIDKYNGLNIYTSDGNWVSSMSGAFKVTEGTTYYLGFSGKYQGNTYTWTANLSEVIEITDIIDIVPEETESLFGLGSLAYHTAFTIRYSNGETANEKVTGGSIVDSYGNTIEIVPKRKDSDVAYSYWSSLPEGEYAIEFRVDGVTVASTEYIYRIVSLENVDFPELTLGSNQIYSSENGYNWYHFQAPATGKYWLDKTSMISVYTLEEDELHSVNWNNSAFKAEEGKSYYLGFSGPVWNTGEYIYEWTANLRLAKEIISISDITPEKTDYICGLDTQISRGTTYTIHYNDESVKQVTVGSNYYNDGEGNAISLRLINEDTEKDYWNWDNLPTGSYALAFLVDNQLKAKTDYIYCVNELDEASLPELTEGKNTIVSSDSYLSPNWYRFTPQKTGNYSIYPYGGISIREKTENGMESVSISGRVFSATAGTTYYIGFFEMWNGDYEWTTTIKQIPVITNFEVLQTGKETYAAGLDKYILKDTVLQLTYDNGSVTTLKLYGNSWYQDEYGNSISISLKNGDKIYTSVYNSLPVGSYTLVCQVNDDKTWQYENVYQVVDPAESGLPELKVGTVEITSSEEYDAANWYRFVAPKTARYRFRKYSNMQVKHMAENGEWEDIVTASGAFRVTYGQTYYIGFSGDIWDEETDDSIFNWTTELQETQTLRSIQVHPEKTTFYADYEQNHVVLSDIKLLYGDGGSQTYFEWDSFSDIDGQGNGCTVYLTDEEGERYSESDKLAAGMYTVHFECNEDSKIQDDYVIQVNDEPKPFLGDEVTLTELSLNQRISVSLDEDNVCEWFSYTPQKDMKVQFQSSGRYDTYGELYDELGEKLTDNDDGGEASNFSIFEALQAGKTYYFKVKLYFVQKATFRVCLTEVPDIESLEVVEHDLKPVYPKGSSLPNPNVLLKATYLDGSSDTFYRKDRYNHVVNREILDASGSLAEDLGETGTYTYQVYLEGYSEQTVKVGEFQVVSLADYASQVVEENQEQQIDAKETNTMRYQFTVTDAGIYQLNANVSFKNLEVYDAEENQMDLNGSRRGYTAYAALQAGTYYVVADLNRDVSTLTVSVKKTVLPTRVTAVYSGETLIAGLDELDEQNLSSGVEYSDGSNAWIFGNGVDDYGNKFEYDITDPDNEDDSWGIGESLPEGTYTVKPVVFRTGTYRWYNDNAETKMLKETLTEENIIAAEVNVVKPDVSAMTAIKAEQDVKVTGEAGRHFYTFTPEENGTYTFVYGGTGSGHNIFCEEETYSLWRRGNELRAKAGVTYVVVAERNSDYQFRIVKKQNGSDGSETGTKKIQSVEICSKKGYVTEDTVRRSASQLYLLVTYEDGTTETSDMPYNWYEESYDSEDSYGNVFHFVPAEEEVVEKEDEFYLQVSVSWTNGQCASEFPISTIEEKALEVTTSEAVQASLEAYFKFVPEETGEYLFKVASQDWNVNLGEFEQKVTISDRCGKQEDDIVTQQAIASLQKGKTYYFNVTEQRDNPNIPYTLSVSKIEKQVTDLKIIDVPEGMSAYAGIGLIDYNWIKAEVTYSDGSKEVMQNWETSDTGRTLSIFRSSWVNTQTYRIELQYGMYRTHIDIPAKEWDYTGVLKEGTASAGKIGETVSLYSFTPSEKADYRFRVAGVSDWGVEVYDSETCRIIFAKYGSYALEPDRTYNVAVYNYYDNESPYTVTVNKAGEVEEHTHSYVEDRKEATCEENGYTQKKCSECGEVLEGSYKEIPALGHELQKVEAKEATCADAGNKAYWTCGRCGKVYADAEGSQETTADEQMIPAIGHIFTEWKTEAEATCENPGSRSRSCTRCDVTEKEEIPALGHELQETEAKEATCTEAGNDAYWTCGRCGKIYADERAKEEITKPVILAKGHDFVGWVSQESATCENPGSMSRSCRNCDATETKEIPALGHHYVAERKEATCTSVGFEREICSLCNEVKEGSYKEIPALGHDYGEWKTTTEPSCTVQGEKTRICNRCKNVETEIIPANGHNFVKEEVKATCTKDGYTQEKCTNCEEVKDYTVLPASGHELGEKIYTVVADCTKNGRYTQICKKCGETVEGQEPMLGHDYQPDSKEATCTENGYTQQKCTRCDAVKDYKIIPAVGHTFGEWITIKSSTCTEKGTAERTCQNCTETEKKVLELAEHSWKTETIKEASETEEGIQALICSVCGTEKAGSRTAIPMTAHQMGEWTTVTSATCTEDGLEERTCAYPNCTICKEGERYKETRVIPALGHDLTDVEWTEDRPASCTEEGARSKICKRCKERAVTEVIPMTAHDYVEEKGKPATCTEDGYTQLRCTICHQVKPDSKTVIPKTGHLFGLEEGYWDYTVEPTCTDQGLITYRCQNDGCTAKRISVLPPVAHSWNSEMTVEKEATCIAEGMGDIRCTNCSAIKPGSTQMLPKTEHNWKTTETIDREATCTADGQKSIHCAVCDAIKEDSIQRIPATGHKYSDFVTTQKATCTENGRQEKHCERCGEVVTEELQKTGHNMQLFDIMPATCEEDGLLSYQCINCGRKQYKVQAALEHDWSTETITIDSSLDENGEEFRTCYRCGKTDTIRIIPSKRQAGYIESINGYLKYGPTEADFQDVLEMMSNVDETFVTTDQITGIDKYMMSQSIEAPQVIGNMSSGATVIGGTLAIASVMNSSEEEVQPMLLAVNSLTDGAQENSGKSTLEINAGAIESKNIDNGTRKYQKLSIVLNVMQPNGVSRAYTSVNSPMSFTLKLADTFTKTNYRLVRVSETARGAEEEMPFKQNEDGTITFTTKNFDGLQVVQGECTDGKHITDGATEKITPATCTDPGKITANCIVCGKEVQIKELEALGHDFTKEGTLTPATCIQDGSQIYECSHEGCKKTSMVVLPATGHQYEWQTTKQATCTESGEEQQKCKNCDATGATRTVEALGHEFGEWKVTKPATCAEDGEETRSCIHEGCAEAETRVIPKTNDHTFEVVETERVDCYTVERQKCSVCGTPKSVTSGVPSHEWGEEQTKAATCTEKGMIFQICKNCEEINVIKTLEISAHKLSKTEAKAATCTTSGNRAYWSCEECGKVFADENAQTETTAEAQVIPATGHQLTATPAKAATCTTSGNHAYWTCEECGKVFADAAATQPTTVTAQNIPAAGHQLTATPAKAATCVAEGTKGYWSCTVCGKVFADQAGTMETTIAGQVLGKVEHKMGGYVETVHPTALTAGRKTRSCSVCGYAESVEVPKLISDVKLTTSKLPLQTKQKVSLSKIVTGMAEGDYIASASSANKKIATVDNKGNVKGVKAGKVKITLNFASGTSRTLTIAVQKKKVATSKITLAEKNVTLKVKEKKTLMALISPITSKDKITYKTSNKKIATVTGKGVITAKKAGTAVITVKAGKKTVKVKVKVTK